MPKKIKSIKQFAYKANYKFSVLSKGEKTKRDERPYNTYIEYDEHGNILLEGEFINLSTECPFITLQCEYNPDGKIRLKTEYSIYNELGEPTRLTKYIYDSNGLRVQKTHYKPKKKGFRKPERQFIESEEDIELQPKSELQIENRTNYKYDDKKQLIEKITFLTDESLSEKITFKYDTNGNKTETIYYNSQNEIKSRYIQIYDDTILTDKSLLVETSEYNGYDVLDIKRVYIRDKQGRLSEVRNYNKEGLLINTDTTIHSEKGIIVIINYGSEGDDEHHYMLYRYDTKNNLLEEGVYNSDGAVYSKSTDVYDKDNNLIETKWIEFADEFAYTTSKYEYNKYNNWIKRIDLDKDIPVKIIEREIEYF